MATALETAVCALRKAADILEDCEPDHTLILPGWEDLGDEDTAAPLRAAARAIAADGVDPNGHTQVPLVALGEMVRYVADMLEE